MKYYGVTQSHYGHDYRYIFDEDTLSKHIYNGKPVPDEDIIDCLYPMGGSNSGVTFIKYLPDDDSIKAFLLSPAEGPDSEDPMLIDIAEYSLTVSGDDNSCTDIFMNKFNLSYDKLEKYDDADHHRRNAAKMIRFLKSKNYPDFDFSDPFYGKNADMTYSELYDIYKAQGGNTTYL